MSKILAFDYGLKRTGLAITDAARIIASPLTTIDTAKLFEFLKTLMVKESISVFVLGIARHGDGSDSETTLMQKQFADQLKKKFPHIPLFEVDEMFTSKLAAQALVMGGMKKSDRREKGNLDKVSAAIILQSYLDYHSK